MLRFIYAIVTNLFRAPYMIPKMRHYAAHPDRHSEEERYRLVKQVIYFVKHSGHIHTKVYGIENLPKQGGYIMYPNHQGKYDALGIMDTHKEPCSVVMDKAKSNTILVKEFVDLVQGKRLEKDNIRQSLTIINEVAKEVISGKRFILFPEGGYQFNNQNTITEFKAGSFKSAVKAKAPIIPVALIDSYKAFNSFYFGKVITQVHYLKPIFYDEYCHMNTSEIASLVQQRIQKVIDSYAA